MFFITYLLITPSIGFIMTNSDASDDGVQEPSIMHTWIRDEQDWSGISDTKARRRIQNRRNQRVYRMMSAGLHILGLS